MDEPLLHIVLYQPEIPQNTGNVGRLCLGLSARLHLIPPLGFDLSERAVRRAGLDYWKNVDLTVHKDAEAFWAWSVGRRLWLFSSHGARVYTDIEFADGDVLMFGCETSGLPKALCEARGSWFIPMPGGTRSLNLPNAIAIVAWEALRQRTNSVRQLTGGTATPR